MKPEDLKNRPRIALERPRRLVAEDRPVLSPPPPPLPSEEAKEVFAELEAVEAKAGVLLDAVKKALVTLSVPVREEDQEVRAAVLRKDPASGGGFITFELYLRALQFEADAFDVEPQELSPLITGHRYSDGKKLQALSIEKSTKLSKKEVALMVSQIMHVYILQLMQMGFQAMESEKQTSTKIIPPASEVPSVALSMVFSIAFQIAYSANHLRDLFDVLDETSKNALRPSQVSVEQAFRDAAKFKLPELRALNLALRSKDPEDYELIRDYARAFVRRTRKIGYEPWLLADDIFTLQQHLRRSLKERERYLSRGVPISTDASKLLRYRAERYSHALDHVATALSETDSAEKTLCSLAWLATVPHEPLSLMKAMLEFLLEAKSSFAGGSIPKPDLSFSGPLMEALVHELLEVTGKASKKLLAWFKKDPERWEEIERCAGVSELLSANLHGIETVERHLYQMLDSQVRHDRALVYMIEIKSKTALEMKKLRMMLMKLNFMIRSAAQARRAMESLRFRSNLDQELFGGATDIGVGLKDRREKPGDFVRQPVTSEFLGKIQGS